jgi:hypothetical protein
METIKVGFEAFGRFLSALELFPHIFVKPDMLWLFGLAFIGLVWIRRKRIKGQVTATKKIAMEKSGDSSSILNAFRLHSLPAS